MPITLRADIDRPHKTYGASSAHRWMACPGCIAQSEGVPRKSSTAADEGTAAHRVAEYAWAHRDKGVAGLVGGTVRVGEASFEITDEMTEGAALYVETVLAQVDKTEQVFIEQELDCPWLGDDIGGTTDSAVIAKPRLFINDYKFGRGVVVDPTWNEQLLIYAYCAMGGKWQKACEEVVLTIIQPRATGNPVKSWSIAPDAVLSWAQTELAPAYRRAVAATAEAKAGKKPLCYVGEHCKWCPGRATCPAQQEWAQAITKANFREPQWPDLSRLSGADLAKLLRYADGLADFSKAIHERARQAAEQGLIIPGKKLVETIGHRAWKEGAEEKVAELLGDAAYAPRKVVSPAQADKAAKAAGVDKKLLAELSERPVTGKALVDESDKRPAIVSSVGAELLSLADFLQ